MALAGAAPLLYTGPGKEGRTDGPHPHPKAYPGREAGFCAPAFASPKPGSPHCPAHPPRPLQLGGVRHGVGQLAKAERLEGLTTPPPKTHTQARTRTHTGMWCWAAPGRAPDESEAERDIEASVWGGRHVPSLRDPQLERGHSL